MLFYSKRVVGLVFVLLFSLTTVYAELKDIVSPNIVINLPSCMLELYSGNTLIKEYPVAIGKYSTPTPIGEFNIIDMEKNPAWVPSGRDYIIPSGPDNPLGYRWMGFFELYGIHGTNAPWSIGQAVSNGCIRMREENAEELFEAVKQGTPVKVTYDRIKVELDSKGQTTIGVYPDVYGYRVITLGDVNEKLTEVGLKGLVNENLLLQVIGEMTDQQVLFAKAHNIKVNGKLLVERAMSINNVYYIPVCPIAKALQCNIFWDEKSQLVWNGKRRTNGVVKGDIVYINEESIKELFGGEVVYNGIENCLEINALLIMINGKFLGKDVAVMGGILAVPILPLADSLGKNITYDAVNHVLTLQGQKVPIGLIDDQPYIQITKINEYFKADIFWNQEKHVIEITYPGR